MGNGNPDVEARHSSGREGAPREGGEPAKQLQWTPAFTPAALEMLEVHVAAPVERPAWGTRRRTHPEDVGNAVLLDYDGGLTRISVEFPCAVYFC
jgi:hypothetical protein